MATSTTTATPVERSAMARFMASPQTTIAAIAMTAIFAAQPNFWTVPAKFLTGAAAAVGIVLINTFGNIGGFAAGYVTGFLKDLRGSCVLPMFVVGGLMVLAGVLMVWLDRTRRTEDYSDAAGPTDDGESALAASGSVR